MSRHAKDKRPYLPPVTRIELSEKNIRGRWILVIVLVFIAAFAISMGIHYASQVQPGWNEIQAISDVPNYSSEFHLMYDFSELGGDAAYINKAVSQTYSQAMEDAYKLFSKDAQVDGFHNLNYLNSNPNQIVAVEEPLYKALALLKTYDNRSIYLAPVYVEYNRVFNSESDAEAKLYDPRYNQEAAAYIGQLIDFISDESSVDILILDGNQVKLQVSQEYLAFAEEYGIEAYLDLGWMRNAFVADYVAEILTDNGYTGGYLSSYDGFNRSLSNGGTLDYNIFDREGSDIYGPAKITYESPMSLVFLRDYPLSDLDRWTYRVYTDVTITSSLIDPDTGVCGTAIPNLVCYSADRSCAEILMEMVPVMFTDIFREKDLQSLKERNIYSIWCSQGCVYYNQQDAVLELLENKQGLMYDKTYVK